LTEPLHDFTSPVDRHGTWSLKWDRFAGRDVIPMWVADMDFRTAPEVIATMREGVDHGIFGYVEPGPEVIEAIIARLDASYGWAPQPDWFVWMPGLVSGLNVVCRAVGEPGDDVLTGVPIYPPFLSAPLNANRRCVRVPLSEDDGRWRFPSEALAAAAGPRSRLFLLCNPHNPVGRAYTRDELAALADVCAQRDLVVCSDEIHCGLVLDPSRTHVPFASLDADTARRTITLMAASKTFNLPGLGTAFALIADANLRHRVLQVMKGIIHRPTGFGVRATYAAYRDGEPWRLALLDALRENLRTVIQRVGAMPGLRVAPVEATYLAWIDCRDSGLADPVATFEAAGVGLYDGADFGAPGFVRLNFGCPPAMLDEALTRMARAVGHR
jgi:cystathionine beta-lyase